MSSNCPATPDTTRGRILVVDDEAELCALLGEFLTSKGYRVTMATSGGEALMKVRQEDLDAVLLDVRIPDMSGLDVLREIRTMGKAMYVVVVTALEDETTRQEARRLGANDYVTKPFHLSHLEGLLEGQ